MMLPSILSLSKQLIRQALQPGNAAVDATVGNGHDTLFLAETVGAAGRVYGFDIQAEALQAARRRLEAANLEGRVTLFKESHHRMAECLPAEVHGRIRAVMFNLGYLPGGDHAIITRRNHRSALEAASRLLAGGMSIVYTGHPEPRMRAVLSEPIPPVQTMGLAAQGNRPHPLLAVEKRREAP